MFIEYSKRSKKEQKKREKLLKKNREDQKKADNLVRKLWGITKPITKVIPSKKLYSRKGSGNFECNEYYCVKSYSSLHLLYV